MHSSACMSSSFCSQPQFLDVELELQSAHMGAHLADQPVIGERMKAKPNESTHSQNLPANICPRLQLQPAPLSRQSETAQLRLPGALSLTWAAALYYLLCEARGPSPAGLGNLSKTRCVISKPQISVGKCRFLIPWSCFSDTCINTEYKDKHELSSSSADKSLFLYMRQLIYSFSHSHSTRLVWLFVGRCTLFGFLTGF